MRRRDNLTAALHMLVEAIFWFWPPVWWLGTCLVAERERACDEAVLASGSDPAVYAESVLKVCKFYVQSPIACAAGVSGADLKQRMEEIMRNSVISRLSISKKSLLAASAAALVLTPVAAGLLWSPALAERLRFARSMRSRRPTPGKWCPIRRVAEAQGNRRRPSRVELTIARNGACQRDIPLRSRRA